MKCFVSMGGGVQPVLLLWLAAVSGGNSLGDGGGDHMQDQLLVKNFTNQLLQVIPFNTNNSSVTQLVINGNLITLNETDQLALASYPALEEVHLEGNVVTHISAKYFSVVPNLRTLFLARNNLKSLDSEAFSGLHVLTSLDLSSNLLTSLPAQLTKDLNNLQVLHLQDNPWNCSCSLINTIGEINTANVTFEELLVTCASPPNQAGKDVFQAAALCSTSPSPPPPPPPTITSTDQHQATTSGCSQQPLSPTFILKSTSADSQNHRASDEQSPVLGNTWKFTACVAALAVATSLLIVCAVKGPSWYKLFHNYRHRRLRHDDDEGNFGVTVFSNKGSYRTPQTFNFEHRKGQAEEDEDGYFEDPYIKNDEEHAAEEEP